MMRFEWKKIFGRRLNVAAMLTGYLLIGICVFSFIAQASFYEEETDRYIGGMEAVRRNQTRAEGQTGVITEEYMTQLIGEIQERGMDLESDEAYVEVVRPLGDIYYFTVRCYTDMRSDLMDRNVLMELDITDGAHFYEQRMKKITEYLNLDFSYGNYKETEKAYWIRKAENTVIPFRWGGKEVMTMVWDIVSVGLYLCFVIVICTSSVFSSEYETDTAPLLLTTKYGKDRLVRAKIAVSVLFTAGYLTTGILLAAGTFGLLFGFQGADLPVQLWNSVIPYNLTVGQACLGNFGILLLAGITIASVMLCCSARLRSSLAALVAGMALLIAPAFFPMSKKNGLWNHINYLFPVRSVDLEKMLGTFVSYAAGDWVIPYVGMVVIVYTVIGAAALLLVRRGFVKAK